MYLRESGEKKVEEFLEGLGMSNFKWYTLVNNWGVTYESEYFIFDSRFLENVYGASPKVFETTYRSKDNEQLSEKRKEDMKLICKSIDEKLNSIVSEKGVQ